MVEQTIKCPKCNEPISIDAVLKSQLEEKIKKNFAIEQKSKEDELENEKKKLQLREQQLASAIKSAEVEVNKKVLERVASAKVDLWKEAQKQAEISKSAEVKMLEEQLKDKDQKLSEVSKNEIEIRKAKNKLEEEKKSFELEKQRQLDEERKIIEQKAIEKAEEDSKYKFAQLQKQLDDQKKLTEEMKRKQDQVSQQLQGEVLELDIEDFLKNSFVFDEIEPVAKGERGADILQRVYTKKETFCGSILYELKRQKNWSEPWITKLKDDQIKAKADIAVIVSDVLPKDINNFAFRKNVYICNRLSLPSLAPLLRSTLAQVALAKLANKSKDEKVELLYRYLSGYEFTQKLGSAVETFVSMKDDLEKEKRSTIARWGKQEKQIERVVAITAGMYGDLRGYIGPSMQSIPALESGEESVEPVVEAKKDKKKETEEETAEDTIDIKEIPF